MHQFRRIRKAELNDITELAHLFDLYRVFYGMSSDNHAAAAFLTHRIVNSESVVYVAEMDEGKIAGFVQLYPLFSSISMSKLWLLNDLYVMDEYRGKGISKKLIDRSKELARITHASGLMLETGKSNNIGNNLYPTTGFELNTDNNFYFWKNE